MLYALGIDSVDIERFKQWENYSQKSLLKLFSHNELAYSLGHPAKSAERLAVRFAVKEAAYKACSQLIAQKISFFVWCRSLEVVHKQDKSPQLIFTGQAKTLLPDALTFHISLTHTRHTATAVIIITREAILL